MKDSSSATERVGRYQLLEPIGGGPSGMVSRAKVFGVAGFERQFAVKRFASELTAGSAAQALSAAARSYGSLEHPRIARMSEFGVAQGQTFTAVEYVAGLDAFRLLQEAKLAGIAIAAGGALALVSQAARAVGYAHGRGLSHLGLCPTNVIVTVDGDVKVTDFGILAATMPARPVDTPRLAHRIPYLAPEQLAGESTSAATDVFVLGVIAYELVTGQRAYRGDTPAAIAQAILAGPPAEPPLPRPIVRVLQRCLARSPFERFPDARALADALDAALRVAPVPGTRKDIGAQIKTTIDRYAALNEGNLSGMVALPQSAPAGHTLDAHDASTQPFSRPDTARTDVSPVVPSAAATMPELPKPFTTVAGIAPRPIPVPPGVTPPPTIPPAPSPGTPKTMLGLPPVKKAQIPGVIPPIARPNGPTARPPMPPSRPASATPPPVPVVRVPSEADVLEPSGLLEVHDLTPPPPSGPSEPRAQTRESAPALPATPSVPNIVAPNATPPIPTPVATSPSGRMLKVTPGQNFESSTGEMSTTMIDELNKRSVRDTSELQSVEKPYEISVSGPVLDGPRDAFDAAAQDPQPHDLHDAPTVDIALEANARSTMLGVSPSSTRSRSPSLSTPITGAAAGGASIPATPATPAARAPSPTIPPPATASPTGPAPAAAAPDAPASEAFAATPARLAPKVPTAPGRSRAPLIVIALLVLGGLGAGGWYLYSSHEDDAPAVVAKNDDKQGVAPAPADAGVTSAKDDAAVAASTNSDAAVVATAKGDAGAIAPRTDAAIVAIATTDAGAPDATQTKPSGTSDKLKISSKPSGARVFIDGADQGVTPLTLPGSADRHTMVLLLPGHDLYIGEVDGTGVFDIALKAVTPSGGHAGIKVLKCKQKERYYVYVDGQPTGQTCPTERIDTVIGNHVVEVYDIVTDSRRKWDIYVKDERLSFRVRIDD